MDPENHQEGIAFELRFMLRQVKPIWGLIPLGDKLGLGAAALMMGLASGCGTAVPLLLGALVDHVQSAHVPSVRPIAFLQISARYLGLIGGAFLLRETMNVARRYLVENACARMARVMTLRLLDHMLRVNLAVLARHKTGALDSRISRSVDGVVRFLRLGFLDFLPAVVTGAFALTTAIWKHHRLGMVMAGVIPISLTLTIRQLISQKGIRVKLMRLNEELGGMVVEQLGGVEYIRAAHTEAFEVQRLDRTAKQLSGLQVRHYFEMSLFGCAKALNEGCFHILVIACAAYFAMRHAISFGDILSLSMLFTGVMAPLNEVHRVLDEGHESSLRVKDLVELLEVPVDVSYDVQRKATPRLEVGQPAIVVRGLGVEHAPRGQPVSVLDDVSFEIRHGESIGIAGRSGAGKSTCVKTLLRLVHPAVGELLLGGVPLEDVPRDEIARLIGYVGQKPFVFAGTVEENISYGSERPSHGAVTRVATMANLHEEILQMPRGYRAQIDERGNNLSGGQCQRLALARTLLHDPPILILDEATSALDNIGERYVQEQLEKKRADRTIILVAHRLSTLRYTDRILVFEGGTIAETGSFCDLVRAGGVFASLVHSAQQ
jgi:ATP-binding cassette subfamily B protein